MIYALRATPTSDAVVAPGVQDYDSILVLGQGTVVEAGSPADLLDDPDGALSSMVEGTGAASAAHLRTVAYAAAGRHNSS